MLMRYFQMNKLELPIECKIYCKDINNTGKVVLSCHGFGGHRDNGAAEKFAQKLLMSYDDMAVVTFNLPGHGNDKGILSLENCNSYLSAVLDYIKSELTAEKVYAYATSFGGYLMLKYIAENGNPFEKLAFRCPAINMFDVLTERIMSREELDRVNEGLPVPVGFDRKVIVSPEFISELKMASLSKYDFAFASKQILIMHGTDDEIVPFSSGKNFCERNAIRFIPVEAADHRFQNSEHMNNAIEQIIDFLI